MEDESDDWMIEDYPSSSKETETTKLRWILNKGFGLGKKVVMTGIVISSAPVVLPPLVVISALGFAFSVPFGLVFASYACTEKVMSKLLPNPTSPLAFEFETDSSEQEEEEQDDDVGFEGELIMEEDEQEQIEDMKRGVEMRIELDEPGSGELQGDDLSNGDDYWPKGIDNYENEPMEVMDENVMEEGYVGEYLENEEPLERLVVWEEADQQKPVVEEREELKRDDLKDGDVYQHEGTDNYEEEVMEVEEEREKEEGYEEDVGEYLENEKKPEGIFPREEEEQKKLVIEKGKYEEPLAEVTQVVIVAEGSDKVMGHGEEEEIVRESTGLLQKIRDGGELDWGVKEASGFEEGEIVRNKEITEVSDKNVSLERLDGEKRDVSGLKENKGRGEKFEEAFEDKDVEAEKVNGVVKGTDGNNMDVTVLEKNEGSVEETEKAVEDKSVKMDEIGGEVNGMDGNKRDDSTSEQNKVNGKVKRRRGKKRSKATLDGRKFNGEVKENDGKKGDEITLDENEGILEKRTEEKAGSVPNAENIVVAGKPNEDMRVVNGESIEASDESISEKKSDYKYDVEDLSLEKKEIAIHQIANAREAAGKSGSNVGDDRRAEGIPYPERLGENDDARDSTAEEIADFMELPVSKGAEPKHTKIASETDSPMSSNEIRSSEEKLWQQIDALRAIVGYKAAHDPTFTGELKALYIFTGVEPPPSFKNPHDLAEVDDKLRFLMSVVGVK